MVTHSAWIGSYPLLELIQPLVVEANRLGQLSLLVLDL